LFNEFLLTVVGGSAVCMGCKGSDEQRYNRYKEIADLVKDLRIIGNAQSSSTAKAPSISRFDPAVLDSPGSKKDRKEAKKLAKAAERMPVVTGKDIERIGKILHPEEPLDEHFERNLLMDKSIEDNVYYHPQTSNSREERHRFISKERFDKSELKLSDAEMHSIMTELKVPDLAQVMSKKDRAIVSKLRDKIAEDFAHDHREVAEIMMRKAGFWRWANRRTYNRLAVQGNIWDYKNGEALAPMAEHEADVVEDEVPETTMGVTADGEEDTVEQEHENGDDDANDDLQSVMSQTSEGSRMRPAYSSSVSRDTSISSVSRTTFSVTDESADDEWATVGRSRRQVKAEKPAFTLKLSANNGLHHLKPLNMPQIPKNWDAFSMLSIADYKKAYESDEEDAVSPLTPYPRLR
jgi:hypothetical protein